MISSPVHSAYAAHRKVYPREVSGRFARLRITAAMALLGIFYGLPWVQWQHRQAILLDLPARKFHLFGLTLFPQDFYLLTWLLIIAALSLFFFTALAGRLWCGYACPQTVWTEIFIGIERLAEGNRSQQMKLDRAPFSLEKLARKGVKQILWVSFAAFTGFTFVGFFSPIKTLAQEVISARLGAWEFFWMVFYAVATYGNAGFLREQVCKYMCPYARFQSAMFDRDSLIISYDMKRGEPRGSHPRRTPQVGRAGDCVDCTLCVQVCPTGIDIRHGLQYECIACAACIDACDSVMDKVGSARGLIRYSTQAEMDGAPRRVFRPRVLVYGAILSTLLAGFIFSVCHRAPVALDVLRDRNTLYRELEDGRIENVFSIRLINKDQREHRFKITTEGLDGASVDSDTPTYSVGAEAVSTAVVRVRVAAGLDHGGHDFTVLAQAADSPDVHAASRARFFSP